jgi:hypothetical protein
MAKSISLADAVANLEKNPAIMKQLAKLKKRQKEFPAKHARQFNMELMNFSAHINFCSMRIGYLTSQVMNNSSDYSNKQIDEMFALRQETIYDLASTQNKHDALVRELDLAVHNEMSSAKA